MNHSYEMCGCGEVHVSTCPETLRYVDKKGQLWTLARFLRSVETASTSSTNASAHWKTKWPIRSSRTRAEIHPVKHVNGNGLTMEEEYLRWLDGRRAVFHNLKSIRDDLGLVDFTDLGMVKVQALFSGVTTQLNGAIEEAKTYVANPSYPTLLSWTGQYGCVSHIANRCRVALEDYADENGGDKSLMYMCVAASRLFQKKTRNFGKWEIVYGHIHGTRHAWCERNGVVCDLTYTQFDSRADRVFVMPASRYPCSRRFDADSVFINEETVEEIEKFYSCDEFVKRKHKAQ